jgi:hypothetical protein
MSNFISVPFGTIMYTSQGIDTIVTPTYVPAGGPRETFMVGAQCGATGGAMYDPPSTTPDKFKTGEHCFMMYGPPVVIGDTFMSVQDGFNHVNTVFHTSGYQPCVACNLDLTGPKT